MDIDDADLRERPSVESELVQETERDAEENDPGYVPLFRPAEGGERRGTSHLWLVSYSDFMTILMIFFLMMYAYTTYIKSMAARKQASQTSSEIKQKLGAIADVEISAKRMTIQMRDDVLFDSGRAILKDKARVILKDVAGQLKNLPGEIIVEGHADDKPVHQGRYRSNWELSAARAFSVIDYFSTLGIPSSRLSARGYGEYRPRVPNTDAPSREKNRRIEILLLQDKGSVKIRPEDWKL